LSVNKYKDGHQDEYQLVLFTEQPSSLAAPTYTFARASRA